MLVCCCDNVVNFDAQLLRCHGLITYRADAIDSALPLHNQFALRRTTSAMLKDSIRASATFLYVDPGSLDSDLSKMDGSDIIFIYIFVYELFIYQARVSHTGTPVRIICRFQLQQLRLL